MKTLVAIITGGRSKLSDRPTRKHLTSLRAAGFTDIEWVVREDQASAYELDEHPLNVYPLSFANDYARTHWRHPTATFELDGFHGAFTGREWAVRSAEQRGYDAVLQLDDNVRTLGLLNSDRPAFRAALSAGRMLALLVELSASTNAQMCGAQLSAVPPAKLKTIRAGFPYSVFVEKTAGRMPYFGPYEDDIMHALEYALHGGRGRTAAVVEGMRYSKESKSKTGMRAHYDSTRGLEIARRYPENVKLRVTRRTSAVNDRAMGVRHILNTRGFTPVIVTDPARYARAESELQAAVREAVRLRREWDRAKLRRRAGID